MDFVESRFIFLTKSKKNWSIYCTRIKCYFLCLEGIGTACRPEDERFVPAILGMNHGHDWQIWIIIKRVT